MPSFTISEAERRALSELCSFLIWLEEDHPSGMWGAVTTTRAVQCLSEITGLTMDQMVLIAHASERRK